MLSRIRAWRRFRGDSKGLAALEFALILPVLITMLFGMAELSLAVTCRSSVGQVASTVADLVAQKNALATSDISNVYLAANTILYPYYPNFSPSKPTIRITSVIYDTTTNSLTTGKVGWSCTQLGSGTLSPLGSTVTFSKPLLSSGGSVLIAEVAYAYTSPTTKTITGSIAMKDIFYTKPRRVAQIPQPSSCP